MGLQTHHRLDWSACARGYSEIRIRSRSDHTGQRAITNTIAVTTVREMITVITTFRNDDVLSFRNTIAVTVMIPITMTVITTITMPVLLLLLQS